MSLSLFISCLRLPLWFHLCFIVCEVLSLSVHVSFPVQDISWFFLFPGLFWHVWTLDLDALWILWMYYPSDGLRPGSCKFHSLCLMNTVHWTCFVLVAAFYVQSLFPGSPLRHSQQSTASLKSPALNFYFWLLNLKDETRRSRLSWDAASEEKRCSL